MATAIRPGETFDRADADRRVRHPLHAIRASLRKYVLVEGLALATLYVALCFWLWLLLDYATWKLFSFDWLYWFTELAEGSGPTLVLRSAMLVLVVGGLLALIILQIFRRLTKEFSDSSVALLLERRYPGELGERLITAVELADPRLSAKYGYSQTMLDATIRDAAERVEKLPVHEIFRWHRLRTLVALAVFATFGLYLLAGVTWCVFNGASAAHYAIRFNQTAATWAQRNVLMQDSYWPPNYYLELIRFGGPELRVPREEERPDVKARAVEWMIASNSGQRGWRALRFYDLENLLPAPMLAIDLPHQWGGWIVDLDDLDSAVPVGAVPREWGWDGATTAQVRKDLVRPDYVAILDRADIPGQRGVLRESIYKMLLYNNWSLDKLNHQLNLVRAGQQPVAAAMKAAHPKAYEQFQAIFAKLAELAEDPSMARTIRRMREPAEVVAQRKNKTGAGTSVCKAMEGNKYLFSLADFKESTQFSIVAGDFWTPWKWIKLVPPPLIDQMRIDKEEPAYLYYRLDDALSLKGKRQSFRSVSASVTGPLTRILIPLGSSLTITAHADRKLHDVRVAEPDPKKRDEKTSITVPATVAVASDGQTFTCAFANIRRITEFDFEFKDDDGVRGSRRVVINPLEDQAPRIGELALLASPRVVAATDEAVRGIASGPRFVITPDAFLKFRGKIEDDHGLSKAHYHYELQEVDFQNLFAEPVEGKSGETKDQEPKRHGRSAGPDIVVGGLVFAPGPSGYGFFAASYYGGITQIVREGSLPPPPPRIDDVVMERARLRLTKKFQSDVSSTEMARLLAIQPSHRKLLLEALELTPDKKTMAGFMQRLKDSNFTDGFLRGAIDFADFQAKNTQRDRLVALAVDDPAEALVLALRALKADPKDLAATRALLEKQPEKMIVTKLDLQDEDLYFGFDLRENLRYVKAPSAGPDRLKQKHYALRVTIVAADNNVETGPGVTSAGLAYNFLIVSEDELLALMLIDQKQYHDILEKAVDEMEKTRGSLEGQLLDYKSGTSDELGRLMAGLAGRADFARKAIRDGGITTKAVHGKLDLLLKEMEFNRLKRDRVDKFKDRIVEPLGTVTAANGAFQKLEEMAASFTKNISADVDKREKAEAKQLGDDPVLMTALMANKARHVVAGEVTLKAMTELITELRNVLDVMRRIVTDDELLDQLTHLEAAQRAADLVVRRYQQDFTRWILEQLGGNDKQ